MKHKKYIITAIVAFVILALWFLLRGETATDVVIKVPVERGDFVISVHTSGELEAKSSENIHGPSGLRTIGIWNVQIAELIPEGTVVEEDDWVATLDRTEISNRLKDLETELEKLHTLHTQTKLDTTMDLRNARNELINLEYALEEAEIALEQSKFEPPATIRQMKINLDKAQRSYEQAKENYNLRLEQAKAKMQEVTASLNQQKRRYDNMVNIIDEFQVYAPKPGMVIYRRSWDGNKVTVGSQISSWDNIVATLPDFSVMMSRTYVNEVDISKVRADQKAEIVVDAFPDRNFTGVVTEVANIGEQRPNSDARVFEVKIQINEFDSILRPAMTTKNTVITDEIHDVLFVPIEAVNALDTVNYVFKQAQNRVIRQQVITGRRNENQIVIKEGLNEEDIVLLTIPSEPESLRFYALEEN